MSKPLEITLVEKNLIDISGLDKAALLQVLHATAAKAPGVAGERFQALPITTERASELLANMEAFMGRKHYVVFGLEGRLLDVVLTGDTFDPTDYDRHNGPGSAKAAVEHLRANPRRYIPEEDV